jgi:hypothetical protein
MISRRGFMQLLGAATAASVGGIALIDTHKTFFLPPAGGWRQGLKVRFVEQYAINFDAMVYRYDATWDSPTGPKQYHVDTDRRCDESAIMVLKDRMAADHGTPNSSAFKLELPRGYLQGQYIYA